LEGAGEQTDQARCQLARSHPALKGSQLGENLSNVRSITEAEGVIVSFSEFLGAESELHRLAWDVEKSVIIHVLCVVDSCSQRS